MFWTNYLLLCAQEKKPPTGLAKELGITSGTVTGWKNGVIPSDSSLQKIANHFGISKWDLLGEKNPATSGDGNEDSISAEKHAYVNSLFDQLPFEKQIQAIDYLKQLLQRQ